jgi:hypothetical protein
MAEMQDKPTCIGFWSKKTPKCGNCPFREECREETNKEKKLLCFGKFKTHEHQCKICPHSKTCREEAKKRLIAKMVRPLPVDVVLETLEAAANWLRANPNQWLMKEMDGRMVYRNGGKDSYRMSDVLKEIVDGTARVQDPAATMNHVIKKQEAENEPNEDGITFTDKFYEEIKKLPPPPPQNGTTEFGWKKTIPTPRKIDAQRELVCVNNTGMESRFDKGVTYLVEPDLDEPDMVLAIDRFGDKTAVMGERFGIQKKKDPFAAVGTAGRR